MGGHVMASAVEQERYSMGDCVTCGDRLDDVSLAAGFSECGDCDPDPIDAAREELANAWPALPAWAIAAS